jgi:uroporphyrin-III C-methyltransferase
VLYMAMHKLREIADALIAGGMARGTPAAVIVAATLPQQRIVVSPIDRLADDASGLEPPGLVVIGDIVTARERMLGLATGAKP